MACITRKRFKQWDLRRTSGTGGLKAEEPKTHHKDRDIDGCAKALDQNKVGLQNRNSQKM
jgi:hypothetical protein